MRNEDKLAEDKGMRSGRKQKVYNVEVNGQTVEQVGG